MSKSQSKSKNLIASRDGYGQGLVAAGQANPNVLVLSADVADSTRAGFFQEKFPDRFIQCGVAEQNMIGIAAGLALSGKIPFVSAYAVFSPGRNWEQLRVSVCYSQTNVKIAASHAGIATGPDGATHQALEDIALTRCLPNLIVLAPCDALETKRATLAAAQHQGPVYLRFASRPTSLITTESTPFKIGQAQIIRPGKDLTLVGCGPLLDQAILAAQALAKENIHLEIINCHTIKPIDKKTILDSVKKTKCLVTLEDHQVMGGLGSAVLEAIAKDYPVPARMIGVQDKFGQSGSPKELREKYKLNHTHIIQTAKAVLGVK